MSLRRRSAEFQLVDRLCESWSTKLTKKNETLISFAIKQRKFNVSDHWWYSKTIFKMYFFHIFMSWILIGWTHGDELWTKWCPFSVPSWVFKHDRLRMTMLYKYCLTTVSSFSEVFFMCCFFFVHSKWIISKRGWKKISSLNKNSLFVEGETILSKEKKNNRTWQASTWCLRDYSTLSNKNIQVWFFS